MMRLKNATLRFAKTTTSFAQCCKGMAAVEFSLILPVMLLMFFGMLEGSEALTARRKVDLAGNTLADIVAREKLVTYGDVADVFIAVEEMIKPYDTTGVQMRVVSVILDQNGKTIVHWSRDNNGAEPYAPGVPYSGIDNTQLVDTTASLISSEIVYPYTPTISQRIFGSMNFSVKVVRMPRKTIRIRLCDNSGQNCIT